MVDEDKEFDEDRLSIEDGVSTEKEGVGTDFEKVSTNRLKLSTDGSKVSTDEQVEGTEEQREGTEDQTKEEITSKASQTSTQTPTSMIFGDDETIATLLLNMSQAKAASKEKEKGVELKDVEEIDRPRPTSTRSLLTLKPLPKIDPKDKGKKKIEEEDESESEDDDIPQAVKKFKQLESDEEMARKIQKEWEAKEVRNKIAEEKATNESLIKNFDDIKARIEADKILAEKLQEQEREQFTNRKRAKSFIFLKGEEIKHESNEEVRKRIKEGRVYKKEKARYKKKMKSRKEDSNKDTFKMTIPDNEYRELFDREDLNVVYKFVMDIYQDKIPKGFEKVLWGDLMVLFNPDEQDEFWNSQHEWKVLKKKYPLKKEIVVEMLKLKLESEEESTMALELIRFIKKILADLESKSTSKRLEEAVIPAEIGMLTLRTAEVDMVQNNETLEINLDLLEERREHVAICEENAKQKWKCTTTQGSLPKPHHKLQARRTSCITEYASRVEEVGKLGPKWEGPYEITKALGNGAYKLRDRDGKKLSRTWNWIGGTELVEAKVVDTAVVITIVAGTPLEVPVLPVKFPTDNGSTKGVQTPIRADHFAVTFSLILSTREWSLIPGASASGPSSRRRFIISSTLAFLWDFSLSKEETDFTKP
ncbi:hypothetical protein Tco_0779497 [Tanacetum coccineum]